MVLRASMERKESRSQPSRFFRSDYPEQDDRNYFCFLSQKLVDGEVRFSKIPL
jgi:succinate dehydrogenase/fumarate reductase flavoprotein subunit